jgi:lipoate-protein ligase A
LIDRILYFINTQTDPYYNLALEEYFLKQVGETQCILYLWQNEKTIVIGKNQNPWKECKIEELEADGGKLVRRLSGGGAVFHDLGNLNFTYLVTKENYDVKKQLEVITKAVNQLGIPAVKSGRNDITVEGRKFSGNAFYSVGNHYYHHGTILVDVDMKQLSSYLNVSREKLVSKGVESVKSRVTNLKEFCPDLDINRMKEMLIQSFGETYGLTPKCLAPDQITEGEVLKYKNKFSSWDWNYGKKMEFNYSLGRRFPWGDIEIQFNIDNGIIRQCAVFSDSLETNLFERMPILLKECPFSSKRMSEALQKQTDIKETEGMMEDIISMILEEGI